MKAKEVWANKLPEEENLYDKIDDLKPTAGQKLQETITRLQADKARMCRGPLPRHCRLQLEKARCSPCLQLATPRVDFLLNYCL
ncbi:hypothetical protein J6590_103918 [Homalodisca vitripennis]|nr:hypothetical protein J6590_103918 [Homalodisca vitripennis]